MGKTEIDRYQSFEGAKQTGEDGAHYWSARVLMKLMGYDTWENFKGAVNRAITSVTVVGIDPNLVFRKVTKHYKSRNRFGEFERPQDDYHMTRFGCYVLAQNGDPKKRAIATAQAYFAIQTRKQEVQQNQMEQLERLDARRRLSETEKEFAAELFRRSVDGQGVAKIRAVGDKALFGGSSTDDMKRKLSIPATRPLADFLPTVTIKAKDLAAEITTHNTKKKELRGAEPISFEHRQNNTEVRNVLVQRGIYPESLPAAEDIKMLERKIKQEDRALPKPSEKPLKIEAPFDDAMKKIADAPPPPKPSLDESAPES